MGIVLWKDENEDHPEGVKASSEIHPDDAVIWTWGIAEKSDEALAELMRIKPYSPGARLLLDPLEAAERLKARLSTAPMRTLSFEGTSVATMVDGIISQCQMHKARPRKIVFEDHGLTGLLFMGRDAVTLNTLPSFRRDFARLGEILTPTSEIYLLHCYAFADEGALAKELSSIVGCPIYGGTRPQAIGNRAYDGPVRQATATEVHWVDKLSLSEAVLHFD